MRTKAGGLTGSCAPRHDVKMWSTSVATRCTRESPEKCAYVRRGRHPSRQDGRARWVAKEYKTHARTELYASTPPLEPLKVVLSEIATGKLVEVRKPEEEYSSNSRQRTTRQVTSTCAGCCTTLVRHARRRTKLGGGAGT